MKAKKLPSQQRPVFLRWLTVIVHSVKGLVIFRKADCPQPGDRQEQHVGAEQGDPHGGPRGSRRSPSSEIPLSYLENRSNLQRSLCCDDTVFSFVISSLFTTSPLQSPPPTRNASSGGSGISENTGKKMAARQAWFEHLVSILKF